MAKNEGQKEGDEAKHREGRCPKCGAAIDYGIFHPTDGGGCYYEWDCTECEMAGEEHYGTTFIGHVVDGQECGESAAGEDEAAKVPGATERYTENLFAVIANIAPNDYGRLWVCNACRKPTLLVSYRDLVNFFHEFHSREWFECPECGGQCEPCERKEDDPVTLTRTC